MLMWMTKSSVSWIDELHSVEPVPKVTEPGNLPDPKGCTEEHKPAYKDGYVHHAYGKTGCQVFFLAVPVEVIPLREDGDRIDQQCCKLDPILDRCFLEDFAVDDIFHVFPPMKQCLAPLESKG